MAAAAVGIELNAISTDLNAGEHLTPEYVKVFMLLLCFLSNFC